MLLATISELSKNGINIVQIKNKKTKTIIKKYRKYEFKELNKEKSPFEYKKVK